MDGVKFSVLGLDEAQAKMRAVGPVLKKKGVRFALRKGANLVRDAAKAGALRVNDPATASVISENIAVRFSNRRFKSTGDVMFRVGVMGGSNLRNQADASGLPGGGTQHWRLVEFGTQSSRAQPFMRPALESNINPAINETVNQLNRWLDRNIAKLQKGGGL